MDNLSNVVPYLHLKDGRVILTGILDEAFQVTLFCPLGGDDQFVVEDERVQVFDDVGMSEGLHQFHLLQTLVSLLGIHHVENLFSETSKIP